MFGDITLSSNIAQYYANPFAQYFTMPDYTFFTPYQNFFGQYTYTPYQLPFYGFQNYKYTNNLSLNPKKQDVIDYNSPDFWEDMGLDLSSKKDKKKTSEKVHTPAIDNDGQGGLSLSREELAKMGFNDANLRERWKHLTPKFQRALIKLSKYAEEHGIKISYGKRSTWRSHQDQIDMKKERGHFAARPGHSPHEKGIAVDITTASVNGNTRSNRENQALLGRYWESLGYRWGGHFKNFAKEPWHFDLNPTRS